MRTEEEIRDKLDELESEKQETEDELAEAEEEADEDNPFRDKDWQAKTEYKSKDLEEQIKLLEWVLGE
jgi:hypothetical protein